MLRCWICFYLMICSLPCFAQTTTSTPNNADITMLVQTEMWATTNTAKVNTRINAVLNKAGLEQVYKDVMQKLGQLSNKSIWHITSFNRSQDKSGLEQVEILAEARLPVPELAGIRDRAKKITHPGETYSIDDIDFHPSAEDIEVTRSRLRMKIYEISKYELANISKAYPDQRYTLRAVNFMPDYFYNNIAAAKSSTRMMIAAAPQPNSQLASSDKVQMSAVLEFVTDKNK